MRARNHTLCEYQKHLFDRFHATAGANTSSSHLGFEAGEWTWVVPLTDIMEVVPVPPMLSIPLTVDWFVGVANIRGSLLAVTDLARFADGARTSITQECRLMLLHARYRTHAALLISRSLGLQQMKTRAQHNLWDCSWHSASYPEADGRIWRELNIRELARSARFLQIAANAAEPNGVPHGPATTPQEN